MAAQNINPIDQMDPSSIINPLLMDKKHLYLKSMEVFYASYYDWDKISEEAKQQYDQHLAMFSGLMMNVYNIDSIDPQDTSNVIKGLNKDEVIFQCGIIRLQSNSKIKSASYDLAIDGIPNLPKRQINLDVGHEKQNNVPTFMANIPFQIFTNFRTYDMKIILNFKIETRSNVHLSQCKEFKLPFREIHPEGFMDWHQVDDTIGIKVLIRVRFQIGKSDPSWHIFMINSIIKYKIDSYKKSNPVSCQAHIRYKARKIKNLQERIDPNSNSAFWQMPASLPTSKSSDRVENEGNDEEEDNEDAFIKYLASEGTLRSREQVETSGTQIKRKGNTKFNDLHISPTFYDEFPEESFCVCNEWCNLNAFFYYNPIFRFLLVRNNQLYHKDYASLAETYLFAISNNCDKSLSTFSEIPLFGLMKSAKNYSEKFFERSLLEMNFAKSYKKAEFRTIKLIGCTYNLLKSIIPDKLKNIQYPSSWKIFSEWLLENITIFYDVLQYFNKRSGSNPLLVNYNVSKFYKELDDRKLILFHAFVKFGVAFSTNNSIIIQEDYLFTPDYENEFIYKSEQEEMTKTIRERIYKKIENPFNVKFICSPRMALMIQLGKFFSRIAPTLPIAKDKDVLMKEQDFLLQIDTELEYLVKTAIGTTLYSTSPDQQLDMLSVHVVVPSDSILLLPEVIIRKYFALKSYGVAFSIQTYFLDVMSKLSKKSKIDRKFATKDLRFIYNMDWMEAPFEAFNGNHLFLEQTKFLEESFTNFFHFWGKSKYGSRSLYNLNTIKSFTREYGKLYLWWINDGNNTKIFQNIFVTLNDTLDDIHKQSDNIFNKDIIAMLINSRVQYGHKVDIIDTLVFWLVKADCFLVIKTAAKFVSLMHLESVDKFSAVKPGWIPLISAYKIFLKALDRIKTSYIAYDDELHRISRVLDKSKYMVKSLFREIYKKVLNQWLKDFYHVVSPPSSVPALNYINLSELVYVHFAVGTSILAAFFNDFRKESFKIRLSVQNYVENLGDQTLIEMAAKESWNQAQEIFKDPVEIQRGMPFLSPQWQNALQPIINDFNGMQIHIDFVHANQ